MSVKYLISFKSGDKKLVDRHFRLNDYVYGLTVNKLTAVEILEGIPATLAFSCPESNIEYIEELPVSHEMMLTFNQIYENINSASGDIDDIDATTLLHLKYEDDEIEKIYG